MASSWKVQQAGPDDLSTVMEIADGAAAWLVERGQTGQWGTTPPSQNTRLKAQVGEWITQGLTTLALDTQGVAQATVTVGPGAPWYLEPETAQRMAADAWYVSLLASRKSPAAQGAGAFLMRHAEDAARAAGQAFLRLDCWAGSASLCAYYERLGFTPCGTFHVGDWQGALYEKPLEFLFEAQESEQAVANKG